ncbi:hypothetical protein CHT97_10190 [Lacticaseibacillus chiayiensis]|nr:hypothetical protein CHT97_10190 [Lacticaseibacillus chiayiensis]
MPIIRERLSIALIPLLVFVFLIIFAVSTFKSKQLPKWLKIILYLTVFVMLAGDVYILLFIVLFGANY